jgi:signal transduction histidine kinase
MVLLGTAVYAAFHGALVAQLDARIAAGLAELLEEYRNEGLAGLEEAIAARERSGVNGGLGYALFEANGRIAGRLATEKPAPGAKRITFLDEEQSRDAARAAVEILPGGLTLVVAADQEPLEEIDDTVLSLLLIALAATAGIGTAGALVLGAYLRKRLGRLGAKASAIMAGDLTQRMPLSGDNDEFDELSASLNAMLDRIVGLLENLRQVSSDIAHDLRTPLSHLRQRLERALGAEPWAMRAGIEDALEKTDELLALFAAILRISEIESQKLKRSFVRFDLSKLVGELCQSFAPAIEEGGRSIQWRVAPGVLVDGDRELLAQAVVNVLENAEKHTPPGTRIDVRLVETDARIRVTIADDGPGVTPQDRQRITGRFVRLEAARTTRGHGLGLNMVAAIAALHAADLELADNRPGLAVSLTLSAPLAQGMPHAAS